MRNTLAISRRFGNIFKSYRPSFLDDPAIDVDPLVQHEAPTKCELGDAVDQLWVERVTWTPEAEYNPSISGVPVVVHGPHDVLRVLAYASG